eukprot:scaffold3222_cov116-Isochrysis_galbana.AAC.4
MFDAVVHPIVWTEADSCHECRRMRRGAIVGQGQGSQSQSAWEMGGLGRRGSLTARPAQA